MKTEGSTGMSVGTNGERTLIDPRFLKIFALNTVRIT